MQHYRFSEFYHKDGYGFSTQVLRDQTKRRLCSERGIILVEVASEYDTSIIFDIIANSIRPEPTEEQVWKKIDKLVEYVKKYYRKGYSEKHLRQLKMNRWKVFHLCKKYNLPVPDIVHHLRFKEEL